jgi:hypothetical protein
MAWSEKGGKKKEVEREGKAKGACRVKAVGAVWVQCGGLAIDRSINQLEELFRLITYERTTMQRDGRRTELKEESKGTI